MQNSPEDLLAANPSNEEPERRLRELRGGKLTDQQIVDTIIFLGRSNYRAAEGTIAALLRASDSEVRRYAMVVLVLDWKRTNHRGAVERILRRDPDSLTRLYAVFSMGALGHSSERGAALESLLKTLSDETETDVVRGAAYNELCALAGPPKPPRRVSRFSEVTDWEPIDRVKAEFSSRGSP